MHGPKVFPALALAGALALVGCTGSIGAGDRPGDEPGPKTTDPTKPPGKVTPTDPTKPTPPDEKPPVVAPMGVQAGVAPLRRLNADQYRNTIKDLFGFTDGLEGDALPPDEAVSDERFLSNVSRVVQGTDFDRYAAAAKAVATKAVAANLKSLASCDLAQDACAVTFIRDFGKRIYRRPLTQVEQDRSLTLFKAGRGAGDAANGARVLLEAMLQSVNFLYLFEFASPSDAGKIVQVDDWAMASRLSYFFLGSMPDKDLFAAAEGSALSTPEQITAQAKRLAGTPAFLKVVQDFHVSWLQLYELHSLEKDAKVFTAWNEPLREAMIAEPRRFVEEVMKTDGKAETLLTAGFSMANGPLASFYGATGPTGDTWQKVSLDKTQRAGLLTQPGLLATLAHENRTSFILRGKMVREGLLCTKLKDPPAGVDTNETNIPPTADARTRSKLHSDNPACSGCHAQFDPLGFAFENYDGLGKFRTMENGKPIDATAELTGTLRLDGPVKNAVDLLTKLAADDEVKECLTLQWMRFALGRDIGVDNKPESLDDLSSVGQAMVGFKAGGWKIADLVAAIATTDSFRYQKVKP